MLSFRRDQLRDQTSLRKLRLDDALESQQFFIQCHELASWITEKDLMVSQKIHIDNDFIQSLLKRIESLELELATHSNQVQFNSSFSTKPRTVDSRILLAKPAKAQ